MPAMRPSLTTFELRCFPTPSNGEELWPAAMGTGASRGADPAARFNGGSTSSVSSLSAARVAPTAARAVPGAAPVYSVPVQAPAPTPRVSDLTDELMTLKAKLSLAEAKLRATRAGSPGIPHTECVLCMDAAVDTVLLPCGHLCLCSKCAESLRRGLAPVAVNCPLCRVRVDKAQRIFLPVHQPPPRFAPNPGISAGQAVGASRVTFSSRKLPALGVEGRLPGGRRDERSPVSIAWAPPDSPTDVDSSALFAKTMVRPLMLSALC
jgi:hypothetical protein